MNSRVERDELGSMELPEDALYGLEAARARENFDLGGAPVNPRLVSAIVTVKKAAAITFARLTEKGRLPPRRNAGEIAEAEKFRAIAAACDRLLAGEARDQFITPALQGGAGTSTNMNVNEVLANLALVILGKKPGDYSSVHPLDDVNRYQSTNDVYPTALRIAAIGLLRELSDECAHLQEALQKKENEYGEIVKLGRTELMDAAPVTLGGEFGSYAQAIARDRWRLYKVEERLRQVNLGGAAVGLYAPAGKSAELAAIRAYRHGVIEELREMTGMGLAAAEYPMDLTQNNDVFVEVSGLLKALAVNLSKIAGDFRLMNSGPRGGLGEIRLAPLQKGSTAMAGKVNPVIPEMTIQAGIRVAANDMAIGMAAARGEFELNAFTPLIADALLDSLGILSRCCRLFREKCVETLRPDPERCAALLESSWAFAVSWVPVLGYEAVSRVVAEYREAPDAAARIRRELETLAR
ncbi:aspartate ammonia-lyase [Spirochaetia bacterium]|nr:aspartate ammonia-lyase [Spirochaetia bacterium]